MAWKNDGMSNATATTNGTKHATFTRMDQSTAEEWAEIGRQNFANQPRVAETILSMLRSLADITDGFATDQLTHCLQTVSYTHLTLPTNREV